MMIDHYRCTDTEEGGRGMAGGLLGETARVKDPAEGCEATQKQAMLGGMTELGVGCKMQAIILRVRQRCHATRSRIMHLSPLTW